jgi:hypothetical protein
MARQSNAGDGPTLFGLRCEHCGHYLARTPSGFLACPLGHGKLIDDSDDPKDCQQPGDDDRWGRWLDDDLPDAA